MSCRSTAAARWRPAASSLGPPRPRRRRHSPNPSLVLPGEPRTNIRGCRKVTPHGAARFASSVVTGTDQLAAYGALAAPLVAGLQEGYSCCLLAYGQVRGLARPPPPPPPLPSLPQRILNARSPTHSALGRPAPERRTRCSGRRAASRRRRSPRPAAGCRPPSAPPVGVSAAFYSVAGRKSVRRGGFVWRSKAPNSSF